MNIEYEIERSAKRKTIQLNMKPDGTIVVKAPTWSRRDYIDGFINSHTDWIESRRQTLKEQADAKAGFSVKIGGKLSVLGVLHPVLENTDNTVMFTQDGIFIPNVPFEYVRPALVTVFKQFAKDEIAKRVDYWSGVTGFRYTSVSINSAKKRWASRSSTGRLNFSWRLVFADSELVDYVVIHELCHTEEMNHSAAFWAHVTKYCPDYKNRRKGLNLLYDKLQNQNWE